MSVTLTNLQTDVRSWLATSTTRLPDSDLTSIINMAIRDIALTKDLRFLEKEGTVTLSAGVAGYALPTTGTTIFNRPFYAFLIDPTDTDKIIPLKQVPYPDFRDKWGIAASVDPGTPEEWTILGNSSTALLVGPTPDQTMTLYLDYYHVPAELAAGGDHNDVTDYAREAVLFKSLSLASTFLLEDDRALMFNAHYERTIQQVVNNHGRSRYGAVPFPQMTEPH